MFKETGMEPRMGKDGWCMSKDPVNGGYWITASPLETTAEHQDQYSQQGDAVGARVLVAADPLLGLGAWLALSPFQF